jgi:hypothetical protein
MTHDESRRGWGRGAKERAGEGGNDSDDSDVEK